MPRIKISLPENFLFTTSIPVRISDINYGNHVGNDAVLSITHELRMQFLAKYGFTELDCGGAGLIMTDAAIVFKNELFYGDLIDASVAAADISNTGFTLYYKLQVSRNHQMLLAAVACTGMVCYDYSKKKIAAVPDGLRKILNGRGFA
jgi:acyl-CoA thioesterase FadM